MPPVRAVVNFAKDAEWPNAWYTRGQDRLLKSLGDVLWPGRVFFYSDETHIGCPPHQLLPYGFKVAAIKAAMAQGAEVILWADASVFAIKPIEPVFEHIEKHGHIFFQAGFNCAQWTNDRALNILQVTRDEAEKMPMLMALCMGFDMRNEQTRWFFKRFSECVFETRALHGAWTNESGTESNDPRCQGHRHDQSVASILAAQLGMELTPPNVLFSYYGPKLFMYDYQNDMGKIPESVVLLAQGMNS
jgi:hypothetical protein